MKISGLLAFCLALLASAATHAQLAYPDRPIRFIVPFTAGSGTDIVARTVGESMSRSLKQPIVIENRAGAGGTLGAAQVAKSAPDGYTLLIHSAGHVANAAIYPNLPYDTIRDFAGVTPLASLPNVLVAAPSKGFKSVADLVDRARANPGALNYGSAGNGSATHMNAEIFRMSARFDAQHIPFKGTPEALTEILTGRVDYYFCPVIAVLQFIKEGKLLALAAGSTKRSSALPEVATTLEAGIPNSDYSFWVGMMVPAKTPRDIVTKLYQNTLKALQSPDLKERMAKIGAEPMLMTPQEFDVYIRMEIGTNAALVKAVGIKVN